MADGSAETISPPVPAETPSPSSPLHPERAGVLCGVYSFIHKATGRRYIGSSRDIERRRKGHVKSALNGDKNCFYKALRQHGTSSFDFEILEICEIENQFIREKHWIEFYNSASVNGFNTRKDPTAAYDYSYSDVTRERISLAKIGNKNLLGYKHTDETKAKISKKLTGLKQSPETCAKKSASFKKKKPMSQETRAKIAAWHKGRALSLTARIKISNKLKGRKLSEEHKAKVSASLIGRPCKYKGKKRIISEEHRAKLILVHTGNKYSLGKKLSLEHREKLKAAIARRKASSLTS